MDNIIKNDNLTSIYDDATNTWTYIAAYDIESELLETSYCSYNVSLSTINFDITYIKKLSNIKSALNNNLLVAAMFDDKMYYNINPNKSSYQYNSLLFINNEKDIIPLSLNIKDINSPLTIINNEIQTRIDNNTIIENNNELSSNYNKLNISNNDKPGIFKVDNNSLIINDNNINLSYTVTDIIENIDEHINIMNNVISQCSYNLNHIMVNFKEYPLYDKKYACNIDPSFDMYYSDETINDDLMEIIEGRHYHHIEYYQHYFKIKIKLIYNYLSGNINDYNPFNEDNLNIIITDLDNNDKININDYIKFNKNKSYIFNTDIISFDEDTNNIFGEVNYVCYFNILNDELYELLSMTDNIPNHLSFNIDFIYNDQTINIQTLTETKLDLFIDRYYKQNHIHNILYHDYNVGFNYDKIGNMVGVCMIQNSELYKSNKPIFMKYFKNEKNYIVNRISNDILKKDEISGIRTENRLSNNSDINTFHINRLILRNDESGIVNNLPLYKDIIISGQNNIHNIEDNDHINLFYSSSDGINNLYNTKLIYRNYLKYAFNNTYNICGNGLRKGDCYVPCLSELALFYMYGFHEYINNSDDIMKFDSSTLNYDQNILSFYYIDYSDNLIYSTIGKSVIGKITVDEYGQYHSSEGITTHTSISLFKLPDYSILSSSNYYLEYNEDDNCELINYPTRKLIKIKVKSYNPLRNIISNDFIFIYDKDNLTLSKPTIEKVSNNIYNICFELDKYQKQYNNVDIYFKDNDESMNDEKIYINEIANNYRRLCKLSIKIE